MSAKGADGSSPPWSARRPAAAPTARAGAVILVGATAAVAALQVLQQAIGQFNPRPVISVLITAAVALTTLALDRARTRRQSRQAAAERERKLERSLLCWPPPLLSSVDPYEVGAFPRRRAPPSEDRYIPRSVDGRLHASIVRSPFVLVYGEPRSGKSRTALETAKKALPDSVIIAPAGSDGLRELVDLDPPMRPRASQALLWLDSLERYHDAFDPAMFDTLEELDVPVTIVATIRTAEYEKLLASSGERGDAARAVAARARAFEVRATLDANELKQAQRLYPGEDFTAGPGPCFASSGREEQEPPQAERAPPREVDPPDAPILRDPLFAVPAVAAILALLLVAVVSLVLGFPKPVPPTLAEQADQIKRDAASHGLALAQQAKVDFHGDSSYLFAFQASDFRTRLAHGSPPPSDLLEIYDSVRGRLVRRFRFQPAEPSAEYQYRFAGDLNGNGEGELLGGYGFENDGSSLALMPFVVFWDDGARGYRLVSLEPEPPALSPRVHPRAAAAALLGTYERPIVLTDAADHRELHGYRVQDFAVLQEPARLVSALAVEPRTSTKVGRVELQASIPTLSGSQPGLTRCIPTASGPMISSWSPGRLLFLEIAENWKPFIRSRTCVPQS